MLRILGIALLLVAIGSVVIFHNEIKEISDTYLTTKEAKEMESSGDADGAIKLYEKKVKQSPSNTNLVLALGALYRQEGENAKAVDLYQTLLSNQPDNMEALLAYGRLQDENPEKRNTVLLHYRKGLKSQLDNGSLLAAIGNVYLKAAENTDETRPDIKNWLYDWSIYYFRHAIRRAPTLTEPRFGLGIAYQQTKRLEKAATSYCNAITLSPEFFEARYNLGLTLVHMNSFGQGYQQLDKSIKILTEAGRVPEAQQLAEQVQMVKNMVYNNNEGASFQKDVDATALQGILSPDCLVLMAPSPETK